MGCDIHLAVEVNHTGKWKRVLPPPSLYTPELQKLARSSHDPFWKVRLKRTWYDERYYTIFGILAGVRDHNVKPISLPRGLPNDMSPELVALSERRGEVGDISLGEHSQSWLLVQELLDHAETSCESEEGYLNPEEYRTLKNFGRPHSWCKNVLGPAQIVTPEAMDELISSGRSIQSGTYTHVSWDFRFKDTYFFKYVVAALVALGDPNYTRIVFGFDS